MAAGTYGGGALSHDLVGLCLYPALRERGRILKIVRTDAYREGEVESR